MWRVKAISWILFQFSKSVSYWLIPRHLVDSCCHSSFWSSEDTWDTISFPSIYFLFLLNFKRLKLNLSFLHCHVQHLVALISYSVYFYFSFVTYLLHFYWNFYMIYLNAPCFMDWFQLSLLNCHNVSLCDFVFLPLEAHIRFFNLKYKFFVCFVCKYIILLN